MHRGCVEHMGAAGQALVGKALREDEAVSTREGGRWRTSQAQGSCGLE